MQDFLFMCMGVLRRQEKKGERIRQKRGEQKEFMKTVVQRVLAEFIEAGRLGEDELDVAAKGVLEKMEAKVRQKVKGRYFGNLRWRSCLRCSNTRISRLQQKLSFQYGKVKGFIPSKVCSFLFIVSTSGKNENTLTYSSIHQKPTQASFAPSLKIKTKISKVMERAVKDYCDKPDRLDLHNPSAWFTHHAHELAFRADPEDLDTGARDWLDHERSMKDARHLTRGDKGNGDSARSRGVFGGRDSGKERKRGACGRDGAVIDGRGKHGGDSRALSDVSRGQQKKTAYAPGYSPGVSDTATERSEGGSSGASFIQVGELKGNTSSDLVSIFPSLRGRGGAAAGRRGGRGRGFQ